MSSSSTPAVAAASSSNTSITLSRSLLEQWLPLISSYCSTSHRDGSSIDASAPLHDLYLQLHGTQLHDFIKQHIHLHGCEHALQAAWQSLQADLLALQSPPSSSSSSSSSSTFLSSLPSSSVRDILSASSPSAAELCSLLVSPSRLDDVISHMAWRTWYHSLLQWALCSGVDARAHISLLLLQKLCVIAHELIEPFFTTLATFKWGEAKGDGLGKFVTKDEILYDSSLPNPSSSPASSSTALYQIHVYRTFISFVTHAIHLRTYLSSQCTVLHHVPAIFDALCAHAPFVLVAANPPNKWGVFCRGITDVAHSNDHQQNESEEQASKHSTSLSSAATSSSPNTHSNGRSGAGAINRIELAESIFSSAQPSYPSMPPLSSHSLHHMIACRCAELSVLFFSVPSITTLKAHEEQMLHARVMRLALTLLLTSLHPYRVAALYALIPSCSFLSRLPTFLLHLLPHIEQFISANLSDSTCMVLASGIMSGMYQTPSHSSSAASSPSAANSSSHSLNSSPSHANATTQAKQKEAVKTNERDRLRREKEREKDRQKDKMKKNIFNFGRKKTSRSPSPAPPSSTNSSSLSSHASSANSTLSVSSSSSPLSQLPPLIVPAALSSHHALFLDAQFSSVIAEINDHSLNIVLRLLLQMMETTHLSTILFTSWPTKNTSISSSSSSTSASSNKQSGFITWLFHLFFDQHSSEQQRNLVADILILIIHNTSLWQHFSLASVAQTLSQSIEQLYNSLPSYLQSHSSTPPSSTSHQSHPTLNLLLDILIELCYTSNGVPHCMSSSCISLVFQRLSHRWWCASPAPLHLNKPSSSCLPWCTLCSCNQVSNQQYIHMYVNVKGSDFQRKQLQHLLTNICASDNAQTIACLFAADGLVALLFRQLHDVLCDWDTNLAYDLDNDEGVQDEESELLWPLTMLCHILTSNAAHVQLILEVQQKSPQHLLKSLNALFSIIGASPSSSFSIESCDPLTYACYDDVEHVVLRLISALCSGDNASLLRDIWHIDTFLSTLSRDKANMIDGTHNLIQDIMGCFQTLSIHVSPSDNTTSGSSSSSPSHHPPNKSPVKHVANHVHKANTNTTYTLSLQHEMEQLSIGQSSHHFNINAIHHPNHNKSPGNTNRNLSTSFIEL